MQDKLNNNSKLDKLKELFPATLKTEHFLFEEGGDQVNEEEEKETPINDVLINDAIFMTGEIKKNLKDVGHIKLDHAKRLEDNMDIVTQSDKNIIFFGSVGAGKTTLTNIICGTDFETSSASYSLTRNVQFSKSLIRDDCIAIDFPGLGSVNDQLNHFKTQQATLSVIPVRMICFVIKFENRHDALINNIYAMKQVFEDYMDNTMIIITHSEPIIQNVRKQSEIRLIIETRLKYKQNRIIFSYKNIDYELLFTRKLKPIMETMKNIPKMVIKSKSLINQMNITDEDNLFKEQRTQFQEEFNKTLSKFEAKFEEYKDNNDAKRALFFALKLYKNKHIRKFSKVIRSLSTDDSLEFLDKIICEIILYSNRIHNQFLNLIQPPVQEENPLTNNQNNNQINNQTNNQTNNQNNGQTNNQANSQTNNQTINQNNNQINNQNNNQINNQANKPVKKFNIGLQLSNQDTTEEYNKFKRCKYCGTIWFRYTGCYSVYCGKRGTKKEDRITGCFKNYFVEFTNGQIIVRESEKLNIARISDSELGQIMKSDTTIQPDRDHINELGFPINFNLLTEEEKKQNEKNKQENKTLLQPIGCGNRFDWNTAEDVTKQVIEILGSDLGKNFTDFYSDVLEIKRELKVKSFVSEIKEKLRILNGKDNLTNEEISEKSKIENIIHKFEEYETLKNAERENLDEIKENSSTQKDEQSESRNKRLKLFEEIIKLLREIDYYILS